MIAGSAVVGEGLLTRRSPWTLAIATVAGSVLLRLIVAMRLPVFQDEAYYWEWSRHLAPGYFDHPPGIAILIRAGAQLLGLFGISDATPLAVRFGALVAGLIAAMATAAMARRVGDDNAALRAAILLACLPLAAGLVLATPDAPLLAMSAATLYAVVRALQSTPKSTASLGWWTATGIALGLAFCSKYTSVLVPASVLIAVVARSGLRNRLREPGPYVACIVAALILLPVLIWNSRHGWISFGFQIQHGLSSPTPIISLKTLSREGEYIGGQAGLASPILFVLFIVAAVRGLRRSASDVQFVLAVSTILTLVFFAFSASRRRVEPNWPAPAYIPAIVLLATMPWSVRVGRWTRAGVWFAAILSALIYIHGVVPVLPIPPRKDPIARGFGWEMVGEKTNAAQRSLTTETGAATWTAADRYQEAAELAFHDPMHGQSFALNLSGRHNQYDLWPGFVDRAVAGDNLVIVLDDSNDIPGPVEALTPHFATVRRGERVELRRGDRVVGERRLWLLVGWKGAWPAPAGD